MPQLSIIIPTYNESQNIPVLMDRISQRLAAVDKEVIIVDDNSPDKTWEIARNLSSTYPWIRVIRRLHDRGLSSAVLAGFAVAEGDYLAVMDADLQHDEQILPQFIEQFLLGADIVVGSRKVEGGGVQDWSVIRKFISWVATVMAKIALRHPVTDPMSGFFALRKEVYSAHKNEINPKGFKILLEFLARAKNSNIQEVGYTFKGRVYGESKLSHKVIFDYLKALYELSIGHYIPVRFLKYAIVGFSGLIVSSLILFICKQIGFSTAESVAASIEVSIITNFILNNYWTFKENQLKKPWPLFRGFVTFQAICLSGAIINQAITLKFSAGDAMNLYIANALGYIVAAVWNYAINVGITWKEIAK
ncbi:MAG: glycosyltransferase [Bdellovibrionota bacterium]